MPFRSHPRLFAMVAAVALLFAACGDDDDGSADSPDTTEGVAEETPESDEDPGESAASKSTGPGSATLTIGDQVFTFDGVRCAVGTDETQSDDFDFVLDARQDGFQLQATTGTFGDEVTFDDIEDFENPRQSWRTAEATIVRDGDSVTAEAQFIDGTDADAAVSGETVAGTLEATCG